MRYLMIDNSIGEYTAINITDDKGRLLITKNTKITKNIVNRLKNFGIYCVCIEDDLSKGIDVTPPITSETYLQSLSAIEENNIDRIFDISVRFVQELLTNCDFLENGYQILQAYDENTCIHSMNVAINAVTLGINMGFNTVRLNNLAVGAMLHDIGKSRIPIEVLNKSGKLTSQEWELMKKHPEYGYQMLDKDILIPATVKAIAYQHHENWDGSGYPRGLKGHNIYGLASIVHICDVFDALVSKRTYKKTFSYYDTIKYLNDNKNTMFNPYYLEYFFKYVPIFKPGDTVTLNNGSQAIILRNTRFDMTRPIIRLVNTRTDIKLQEQTDLHIIS